MSLLLLVLLVLMHNHALCIQALTRPPPTTTTTTTTPAQVGHIQHGGPLTIQSLLTLAYHLVVRNVPWLYSTSYHMILLLSNAPFKQLHDWLASGALNPVPARHVFPLQEARQAMELLDSHRASGKVVLVLDPTILPSPPTAL